MQIQKQMRGKELRTILQIKTLIPAEAARECES